MENTPTIKFLQKWMSVTEVARALLMSRQGVSRIVKREGIPMKWHQKEKGRPYSMWLIDTDALSEFFRDMTIKHNPKTYIVEEL